MSASMVSAVRLGRQEKKNLMCGPHSGEEYSRVENKEWGIYMHIKICTFDEDDRKVGKYMGIPWWDAFSGEHCVSRSSKWKNWWRYEVCSSAYRCVPLHYFSVSVFARIEEKRSKSSTYSNNGKSIA